MNTAMLYHDGKVCRLCEEPIDTSPHLDGCPGDVIDNLSFEIKIDGANCGCGCSGYTRETYEGADFAALVTRAADGGRECMYPSYSARMVYEMENPGPLIRAEQKRITAARETEEAREEAAAAERDRIETRERSLAALEEERPDLVPEAYERRKREIEAA